MKKLSISLVVLGGCFLYKGPHVPSDLQGDIPIRIANQTSDPICAVIIMPYAGAVREDNWLGTGLRQESIAPGGEREFKIKAGEYRVGAGACNSKWAAGTQQSKLDVQSATYVAIGGKGEAPPSYRPVELAVVRPGQAAPAGGGGGEAAEPASEGNGECTPTSCEAEMYCSLDTHRCEPIKATGVRCEHTNECRHDCVELASDPAGVKRCD